MFIKYLLIPELSPGARVTIIALHPRKPLIALALADTNCELLLCQYSFSPSQLHKAQMELKSSSTMAMTQEPLAAPEQSQTRNTPLFEVGKNFHREKAGMVLDIKWTLSGEGLYLVKNRSISLYEFDETKTPALKVKHIYEDRLEICAFCLGPSEGEFAYGTLDGRVVTQQQISALNETVDTGSKVVSLSWDPLGKYLCWLNIENKLAVYSLAAKRIETLVSLSLRSDQSELFVCKEERTIDFSPDLNYLLVPSLDDKKMPFVCALRRSQNFQVEATFAGPFSSITCVKFFPGIFDKQGGVSTVFAMGDAFGQISIWELSDKKLREAPLCLLKNDDSGLTIGSLEFDPKGQFLLASTDKKFLICAVFDKDLEELLGPRLSVDQFLLDNYGSTRPGTREHLRTYKDLAPKAKPVIEAQPIPEPQKQVKHFKKGKLVQPEQPNNQTEDTLPQEEKTAKQASSTAGLGLSNLASSAGVAQNQAQSGGPQPVSTTVREDSTKAFMPVLQKLGESGVVNYSRLLVNTEGLQLLYKVAGSEGALHTKIIVKEKWDTSVEGAVCHVELNDMYCIVYTAKGLVYILWTESGRRAELPLKVEGLAKVALKNKYLLLLEATGKLKVIQLDVKKITHKSEIKQLLACHYLGPKMKKVDSADWFKEHGQDFALWLTEQGEPILKLDSLTYLVYAKDLESWAVAPDEPLSRFFDLQENAVWQNAKAAKRSLGFEQQTEQLFEELMVNPIKLNQNLELKSFFASRQEAAATNNNVIAKTEEEMLYWIEQGDKAKYNECLRNYILELANEKQFERLKSFLLVSLLSEGPSKDRLFLSSIGVKVETIVGNALKILEQVEYCKGVVEEIRQAMELARLNKL